MAEDFSIEREVLDKGVVRLILSRAPVNALSSVFLDAFGAVLDELSADSSCRAILITSPFKVLSAGLDLKEASAFQYITDGWRSVAFIGGLDGAGASGSLQYRSGASWER